MTTDPRVREYIQERLRSRAQPAPKPRVTMAPNFPYGSPEGGLGYQAGSRAYDMINGKQFLKPLGGFMNRLGHDDFSSILAGAGAGGVIGAGAGIARGSESPGTSAATGAGIGAVGAFLLSKLMAARDNQESNLHSQFPSNVNGSLKYAFYGLPGGPNPVQFIQTSLFHDMALPPGDKSMLMGLLPNLNVSQAQTLSDSLRGTMGAGAGALIARYLFKLGLGGQALLAMVGGAVGSSFGGLPRNATGQRVNTHYDSLGRQRLV